MKKNLWFLCASAAAIVGLGCHVWVEVPERTTVRARNDMTDLEVSINGVTTSGIDIDLNGVTIGDVYFDKIKAGRLTNEKETERSGTVNIYIASADAIAYPLGIPTILTFEDIDPMETDIDEGEVNTVIFDENTAGVVLSALAKKRAVD